jgi:hypothetical protein
MKLLAIFLALTAVAGAEDILPKALPKDRYAETIGKSPFVLETKAAEPEVAQVNPFQNLYLRSVSKADGKDYVLVQRLGEEHPLKPFIGDAPGDDGYIVKSVRVGNSFRETKVVLQKGSETGEIGFKEDTINAPPAAPAGQNRGAATQPGQPPRPGAPMPTQVPAVRPTQPGIPVQAVPRPGGAMPMPQPVAPQPMKTPQTPGAPNGRVRVINNG